jgi:hypothetical protein
MSAATPLLFPVWLHGMDRGNVPFAGSSKGIRSVECNEGVGGVLSGKKIIFYIYFTS